MIKKEFKGTGSKKGYSFTQIKEGVGGFIYEVCYLDFCHYEVFKRRKGTYPTANGERIEYTKYPQDKDFGDWAWACMTLEGAEKRFNSF